MSIEIKRFHRYRARVAFRRGGRYRVLPQSEPLDGKEIVVEVMWKITAEDNELYTGEWAMKSKALDEIERTWIASGDLEILGEVPDDDA
jgi:hypothetical protein